MDFKTSLEKHVSIIKNLVCYRSSNDVDSIIKTQGQMYKNNRDISDNVAILFHSNLMGHRFKHIWEQYTKHVMDYINIIFENLNICIDFSDSKSYRKAKNIIRSLRKNCGELVGFFARYLGNRRLFKPSCIHFFQSVKDMIDVGQKIAKDECLENQFKESFKLCQKQAKQFGTLIDKFVKG